MTYLIIVRKSLEYFFVELEGGSFPSIWGHPLPDELKVISVEYD
jgi:hypothetical protein